MNIIEVTTDQHKKQFIELPISLYKDDKSWVRPWNHDIENVFDKNKNFFHKEGKVTRWILEKENEIVGRIAAFTHPKLERSSDLSAGGCGFFECINNQKAANLLFDTAKSWLNEQGKEAMDGPINFGEHDKWWGLLIDGFTPPMYGMAYHLPYYKALFENYGFQTYYNQYVYRYDLERPAPRKIQDKYENLILTDDKFSFDHLRKNNMEKYAEDFRQVYNEAWAKAHSSFKPMSKEQVMKILNAMKPIMDTKAVIFGYYDGKPVGFFIAIPNLNEIVKHLDGKFNFWSKIKFTYHLKVRKTVRNMIGVVFGVVPEFQSRGVDAGMIMYGAEKVQKRKRYDSYELTWIGDFNPKMMGIANNLGAEQYKHLVTYRYQFDREKEFKRHKVMDI